MSYSNVSHYLEGEGCSVWQPACMRDDVEKYETVYEKYVTGYEKYVTGYGKREEENKDVWWLSDWEWWLLMLRRSWKHYSVWDREWDILTTFSAAGWHISSGLKRCIIKVSCHIFERVVLFIAYRPEQKEFGLPGLFS